MKFQIYVDGEPTSDVFDTLDESIAAAIGHVLNREEVSIRTGHGTWRYDYEVEEWVAEGRVQPSPN